jgi:hypothetical protein
MLGCHLPIACQINKKSALNFSHLQSLGLCTKRRNAGWLMGLYQYNANVFAAMTAHE